MKFPLAIFLTTSSLLWGLSLPALAQQIWSGMGKIVSGVGEGALVQLDLQITDDRLQFLSGPSQAEAPLQLNSYNYLNFTVQTNAGTWQFFQKNNSLEVTLRQTNPDRFIQYFLELKQ